MPWLPELFSEPVLRRVQDKRRRERLDAMPYFEGFFAGEPDALVGSFGDEPELDDPVRGHITGEQAFRAYVSETSAWLAERNVAVEDVEHVVLDRGGFEEVVLHFDAGTGRAELPFAIVGDHPSDAWLTELRVYYSSTTLTGRHANRRSLLAPDPGRPEPDVVGEHLRALRAGDVDALLAAFEPDGYVRGPEGSRDVHAGPEGLRAFYARLFANGGGFPLETCGLYDDGRTCALEYNLAGQPGVAVYVRGQSGRLAAARIYDDADWARRSQPWNGA